MTKPKKYLEKKKFLDEKDPHDKTTVIAEVRRFEWGGYSANLSITSPAGFGGDGGVHISCNPDNKESYDEAMRKVQYLEDCLKEFKDAAKQAHKDSNAHNSGSKGNSSPTHSSY